MTLPFARPTESRDPATGEVWRSWTPSTRTEVDAAVSTARRAQAAWAAHPVAERVAVLRRFHRLLFRRRHDVALRITRELGKPTAEALMAEVLVVLDFAAYYARRAPKLLAPRPLPPVILSTAMKKAWVEPRPYGVVAVVSPWNYPFMLAAGVVIPALVAGNAVVLKPSEWTPGAGATLVALLHEAGVPTEALQLVVGDGAVGAALVAADVDKVSFTGSVATGRKVAVACADRLIPCSLELGGSDPAIVLDDADLARTARGLTWARFSNAGQTCVAPKRVIVLDAVHDRLLAAMAAEVGELRVGPGSAIDAEVAPLVRPSQGEALASQRDDALARGARVVARADAPAGAGWFAPTLLADAPPDARVLLEETFGPLLPVVRARDEAHAVELANATEFGLSASVWSGNPKRAERVARGIRAGSVMINDANAVAGMANVPHGGVKRSGIGRAHGDRGLMEFTVEQVIVTDRLTMPKQPWWFRYGARQATRSDLLVTALHGEGLGARLRALWRLRRFL